METLFVECVLGNPYSRWCEPMARQTMSARKANAVSLQTHTQAFHGWSVRSWRTDKVFKERRCIDTKADNRHKPAESRSENPDKPRGGVREKDIRSGCLGVSKEVESWQEEHKARMCTQCTRIQEVLIEPGRTDFLLHVSNPSRLRLEAVHDELARRRTPWGEYLIVILVRPRADCLVRELRAGR